MICKTRTDRKNGLSWPTNILQVLAICVLLAFTAIHFVLVVQYTRGTVFYIVISISAVLCSCTVISKMLCTVLDPADSNLTTDNKSAYGRVKPIFDRAKQGHVITADCYCQICTTTVNTTSRHCSQCNKCILRFDHHCDYINNCVGKHNYMYYIMLLLSASIYSLIIIANILYILFNLVFDETSYLIKLGRTQLTVFGYVVSSAAIISLLVILLVLALIAFILVSNLSRLHLYLIYHGWTTWDFYCRPKSERLNHSYWKYSPPMTDVTELSSGVQTSSSDVPNPRRLCDVVKPMRNKTSPMPPHVV